MTLDEIIAGLRAYDAGKDAQLAGLQARASTPPWRSCRLHRQKRPLRNQETTP